MVARRLRTEARQCSGQINLNLSYFLAEVVHCLVQEVWFFFPSNIAICTIKVRPSGCHERSDSRIRGCKYELSHCHKSWLGIQWQCCWAQRSLCSPFLSSGCASCCGPAVLPAVMPAWRLVGLHFTLKQGPDLSEEQLKKVWVFFFHLHLLLRRVQCTGKFIEAGQSNRA